MRRYGEAIQVRPGLVGGEEGPAQFLWRGRLWLVRSLLTTWVSAPDWWRGAEAARALGVEEAGDRAGTARPGVRATGDDTNDTTDGDDTDDGERQVWRVEAGRGVNHCGVFDLSRSTTTGEWRLDTCLD